jgi:hypothetical protein
LYTVEINDVQGRQIPSPLSFGRLEAEIVWLITSTIPQLPKMALTSSVSEEQNAPVGAVEIFSSQAPSRGKIRVEIGVANASSNLAEHVVLRMIERTRE